MRNEPEHVPKEDGWCGYLTLAMANKQNSSPAGMIDDVNIDNSESRSTPKALYTVKDVAAASFLEFLVP